ncbi:hypothetical protein H5410_028671, partial [Solanum commersonii]
DFNVIISNEEKKGDRSHRLEESIDFIVCLNEYGLQDVGYTSSNCTWCDNIDPPTTIWQRLDIMLYNTTWFDSINNIIVTHLSRTCSDHAPILECSKEEIYGNTWYVLRQKIKKFGFSDWWFHFINNYISNNFYRTPIENVKGSKYIYKGFHMNSNRSQINHLSFADNTILFYNGSKRPLEVILRVLKTYEAVSEQLMNKDKSCFTVSANTNTITINRIKRITSMNHEQFPIKYLGCPLFTWKKKISHYSDIVNKIINKIRGWYTKLLSMGGRVILMKHFLLVFLVHLLSTTNPLMGTIELIEKYITRFFWYGQESRGKYHWVSWKNLCYPYSEGETNFRSLTDTCQTFQEKQWWNLRTTNSL